MDRSFAAGEEKEGRTPSTRILSESFRPSHVAIVVTSFFLWKPSCFQAIQKFRSSNDTRVEIRRSDLYHAPPALAGFFITDLGHDEPTILLTNDQRSSPAQLIGRYAKRMLIENALSDAVRFFHIDALSSSAGFKVDFDMALLVLASGLYRSMARRMRGYDDAQARQIFRDLIDMSADVAITEREVTVRFHRRASFPSSSHPISSTNPSPFRGGTDSHPGSSNRCRQLAAVLG
jgi:hypothetical protein